MRPPVLDDRRLLSKCLEGNRDAWEKFVTRFSGLVYKSVKDTLSTKDVCFSREDLEDLHNSLFLRLFENNCKKLGQYQGKNGCSPASWLRVVTIRMTLNHIREGVFHNALHPNNETFENLTENDWENLGPLAFMEQAERQQAIHDAMQILSPRDRLFIKLHFEDGLLLEEVAEALNVSMQNVYTVKHRAVQRLRSHLNIKN